MQLQLQLQLHVAQLLRGAPDLVARRHLLQPDRRPQLPASHLGSQERQWLRSTTRHAHQ
jgi:hypothetical protein